MSDIPFDKVIEMSGHVISHQFFDCTIPEKKIDKVANQILEAVIDNEEYIPSPLDADRMYQLSKTIILMHNEDEDTDKIAILSVQRGVITIESIHPIPSRTYE